VPDHGASSHDVALRRSQKAFELPDRVNNLFAIILLLAMEWGMYLHIDQHDWAGAAALRIHPKPKHYRKLLTSNPTRERKPKRTGSCAKQSTASVHIVFVVLCWGAFCAQLHQIVRELMPTINHCFFTDIIFIYHDHG